MELKTPHALTGGFLTTLLLNLIVGGENIKSGGPDTWLSSSHEAASAIPTLCLAHFGSLY